MSSIRVQYGIPIFVLPSHCPMCLFIGDRNSITLNYNKELQE